MNVRSPVQSRRNRQKSGRRARTSAFRPRAEVANQGLELPLLAISGHSATRRKFKFGCRAITLDAVQISLGILRISGQLRRGTEKGSFAYTSSTPVVSDLPQRCCPAPASALTYNFRNFMRAMAVPSGLSHILIERLEVQWCSHIFPSGSAGYVYTQSKEE